MTNFPNNKHYLKNRHIKLVSIQFLCFSLAKKSIVVHHIDAAAEITLYKPFPAQSKPQLQNVPGFQVIPITLPLFLHLPPWASCPRENNKILFVPGFCRKSHTFRGKTLSQGCFEVLPIHAHAASQSRSQMDMYCLLPPWCPQLPQEGGWGQTEEGVSHGGTLTPLSDTARR